MFLSVETCSAAYAAKDAAASFFCCAFICTKSFKISSSSSTIIAFPGLAPMTVLAFPSIRAAAQVSTGKSVELFRWLKYTLFSGCFFTMIFTRISLSFSMDANCASGMVPPLYSSTQVSSARNMVSTSENPNLPKILPPTVAQFRNCTPTMCRTLSRIALFV